MRILAVIVFIVLFLALAALVMLTYVMSRDLAEERALREVEAHQAMELNLALDNVLVENEDLRESNAVLKRENANLVQQVPSVLADPAAVNPEAHIQPALERVRPAEEIVFDNGRSDRKDYIEWIFDWPDVEGASRYNLYVIGGRARIPLIDTETDESAYVHLALGSYIADSNRSGWTWNVRALVDGEWSEWSDMRSFDVEPLNTAPPVEARQETAGN